MPLPSPSPTHSGPPVRRNITAAATAAILDDDAVDEAIRISVLVELEEARDASKAFREICEEETLRGPLLSPSTNLLVGHAMPLDAFKKGLALGWFGGAKIGDPLLVERHVERIRELLTIPDGSAKATAYLRAILADIKPQDERVTWYYYGDDPAIEPLVHARPELPYRLALPCVVDCTADMDFIVFALPADRLEKPKKPRFTDAGDLSYLELWRPGGKTKPWLAFLAALGETVANPVPLAHTAIGMSIFTCSPLSSKLSLVGA